MYNYTPASKKRGVYCFTLVHSSVHPSETKFPLQFSKHNKQQPDTCDILHIASSYSAIWRKVILCFLLIYFLCTEYLDFYTYLTYMHNFRRSFLSNYNKQQPDILHIASSYSPRWCKAILC
jgi:hypothetical protein